MISTKLCSIITILLQIHLSLELNIYQQKIKDSLVTSTSTLSTDQRMQIADALNSFLPKILPQATIDMIGLSELIVEFKAQCLSGQVDNNFDEAIKWGNIAANELQEQKTLEELNALMKSIGEEQQSNEISAARHLAIHFKNKAKHIMENLTFYSEDILEDLANNSVHTITKETEELHQWFNKRTTSV